MFEITPFFPTKPPHFAIIFYREFFARPPTNTRVFPISGMIFIGEWRYPRTYFRDRFPIYVIFFFLKASLYNPKTLKIEKWNGKCKKLNPRASISTLCLFDKHTFTWYWISTGIFGVQRNRESKQPPKPVALLLATSMLNVDQK